MNKHVALLFCSILAMLIGSQTTRADILARYECNMVDFFTQEPIGDRPDHYLSLLQYSCIGVDGLLKGVLYSGSNTIEWDGLKGKIVVGGGIHRIPGGRLVTELTEGGVVPVMKDGKLIGNESNIGVHGSKVDLHLERLWSQNISITTRLVDTVTTPMLLKTVRSRKINPGQLITHRFPLDRILDAYDTFSRAADTGALKVIISA